MVVLAACLAGLAGMLAVRPRRRRLERESTGPSRARTALSLPLVVAAATGVVTLWLLPAPAGWAVAPFAALAAHRWASRLEPSAVHRRRRRLEAALPEVVDLMATSLCSGASPTHALAAVAAVMPPPMAEVLAQHVARLRLGADPVTVWASMEEPLAVLGRTLRRASETGAPVGDALERLADELRAVRRSTVMVRARSVEVKAAVPLGVCLLPAFVLVGVVPLVAAALSGSELLGW